MNTRPHPPFALSLYGPREVMFTLSDWLGFETELPAHQEILALSLFEDSPDTFRLQALFESRAHAESCLASIKATASNIAFEMIRHDITQLDDEDWVRKSQSGLPPVIAGRFCIYGQHDQDNIPQDIQVRVQIEAGQAFGTGHHGTTKACLLALDEMLEDTPSPEAVLDLGCGAGILAIAYAMATGGSVLATDIDADAVAVTHVNAAQNGVADRIKAVKADGFNAPDLKNRQFDLIFANILAEPLMGLAADIIRALNPRGRVILSGILDEKSETVAQHFRNLGLDIHPMTSVEGWTNLIGTKPGTHNV